jgi:hypothetical protein
MRLAWRQRQTEAPCSQGVGSGGLANRNDLASPLRPVRRRFAPSRRRERHPHYERRDAPEHRREDEAIAVAGGEPACAAGAVGQRSALAAHEDRADDGDPERAAGLPCGIEDARSDARFVNRDRADRDGAERNCQRAADTPANQP